MIVSAYFADSIVAQLADLGYDAWRVGAIEEGKRGVTIEG